MNKIKKLFRAKELYHRECAKIPFEEKIKILVELQKMANEIKSSTGRKKEKNWKI